MGRSRSRSASRGRSRSRGGGGKDEGPLSVLVRNLDYASSPDDVREGFRSCGQIKDVYLPLEYGSRKPKGFGFVKFENASDAHYAVKEMDGQKIGDKAVSVIIAQDRRKSPDTMKNQGIERGRNDREWHEPRDHWARDIPIKRRSESRRGGGGRKRSRSDRRRKDSRRR